jgi:hypothetical protein
MIIDVRICRIGNDEEGKNSNDPTEITNKINILQGDPQRKSLLTSNKAFDITSYIAHK